MNRTDTRSRARAPETSPPRGGDALASGRLTPPSRAMIPRFFLYGEPPADVERDFLHVEAIALRSGLNDWLIRPHAHPDHLQILLVSAGGGEIRMETMVHAIEAPSLVVIPSGVVHAIEFRPGTDGFVVTAADVHVAATVGEDAALRAAIRVPACHRCDAASAEGRELDDAMTALAREFVWAAPARRAAITAHFTRVLICAARLGGGADPIAASRDFQIVHRFRELVERHFRDDPPIAFYADRLHVTHARLNVACRAIAGRSASRILAERIVIEAKRNLLYTGLGVAEVAQSVGMHDAAYFCRFFTRHTGIAPSRFRENGGSPA